MPQFNAWTPADWAAAAAWATVLVATVAAKVALSQVKEARRLREEQAQPYVVAFMERSSATPRIMEFVVKNFGTTAARDVTLSCEPPLRRSSEGGGHEDVWLFDVLPVLVPGQEWRTVWDAGRERKRAGLPDRYRVVAAYKDSRGREIEPVECILDWGSQFGRIWVDTYGVHDIAKSVREIEKSVKRWSEGVRGGLKVFVRSGEEKDKRERAAYEAWQATRKSDANTP